MGMWSLIIPPFIIVVSLGGLLWFLSRRMKDADITEKLSSLRESTHAESQSRSLSRRAFFLKLLEMIASKFKTSTLRIHNFFQHSLERLRRQRTELDSIRKSLDEGNGRDTGKKPEKPSVFARRKAPADSSAKAFLEEELFPESGNEVCPPAASVAGTDEIAPRPMLREKMVHPETVPGRRTESPREETLIARIVENPRDAAAYEELGDCYFAAQNFQDAKECYRQALKLHPTNRAVKIKIRRLEKVFEERAR